MYIHPKLAEFSETLEKLFNEVDEILETRWGNSFSLHPNRPSRGSTENPEMNGLFEVAPDFTAGYGSETGRGYIISLRVATLDRVPKAEREMFLSEAAELVAERLPIFFPGRDLRVAQDERAFKIVGDFSLGMA